MKNARCAQFLKPASCLDINGGQSMRDIEYVHDTQAGQAARVLVRRSDKGVRKPVAGASCAFLDWCLTLGHRNMQPAPEGLRELVRRRREELNNG
jgi:hypothetical protein